MIWIDLDSPSQRRELLAWFHYDAADSHVRRVKAHSAAGQLQIDGRNTTIPDGILEGFPALIFPLSRHDVNAASGTEIRSKPGLVNRYQNVVVFFLSLSLCLSLSWHVYRK